LQPSEARTAAARDVEVLRADFESKFRQLVLRSNRPPGGGPDLDDVFSRRPSAGLAQNAEFAACTGPFAGLSPTKKKAVVRGISLYRPRDGKITETRNQADLLALFTQLGTIEQKQNVAA
jgi:hypothetical protein